MYSMITPYLTAGDILNGEALLAKCTAQSWWKEGLVRLGGSDDRCAIVCLFR